MRNPPVKSRAIKSDSMLDRKLAVQKTWTDDERIDRLRRAMKIQERLAALLSLEQECAVFGRRSLELAS